jgi:hypothetical protein
MEIAGIRRVTRVEPTDRIRKPDLRKISAITGLTGLAGFGLRGRTACVIILSGFPRVYA